MQGRTRLAEKLYVSVQIERERFGPHCGFQRAHAMDALVSSVHSCIGKKQPRSNPAVAAGVLLARGVLTHL